MYSNSGVLYADWLGEDNTYVFSTYRNGLIVI